MKKLMFALCTLMMCFLMASCNEKAKSSDDEKDDDTEKVDKKKDKKKGKKMSDSTGNVKQILRNAANNGADWDVDEWKEWVVEAYDALEDFFYSNPSKEDYEQVMKMMNFADKLPDDAEMLLGKASNDLEEEDEDIQEQLNRIRKGIRKLEDKFYKEEEIEMEEFDDDYTDLLEESYPDSVAEAYSDSAYYY